MERLLRSYYVTRRTAQGHADSNVKNRWSGAGPDGGANIGNAFIAQRRPIATHESTWNILNGSLRH